MSKESYARGFVKAAAAAGVDPTELAKFASVTGYVAPYMPTPATASTERSNGDIANGGGISNAINMPVKKNKYMAPALVGGLLGGLSGRAIPAPVKAMIGAAKTLKNHYRRWA